jgi:exodeoxyribonuclease V gamma subunit
MQWLCQIRSQKVGLSEVIEITRLTVVAKRFGFDAEDLEILESWLTESGARWGLNVSHRKDLGFEVCGHTNTLLFGLQRMVLGYLSGSYDSQPIENQDQTWIQPHSRVEGLDAQVVGHFAMLLDALIEWWSIAANAKTAQEWAGAFSELISQWIEPENSQDVSVQMALRKALDDFILSIDAAQYDGVLELEVAAKVWFEILKLPPKRQRLRASGVTFCTMKTMRSIPFKVICLIGLNEGDFPKSTVIQPFDLMKMTGQMRAGDRSHKEDDRALMLEALLSARQTLYISWSGFGIRDNSYQSPSVLVTQFRQYIRAIGGDEQLKKMTTTHPAQPFGRSYFDQASTQWTFAKEWEILYAKPGLVTSDLDRTKVETPSADLNRVLSQLSGQTDSSECLHSHSNTVPVALKDLFAFIKNPSKYYFRHELRINFDDIENNLMDSEPLSLKGLELYAIKDEIMRSGLDEKKRNDIEQAFRQKTVQLSAQGRLGMGQLAQGLMQDTVLSLMAPVSEYWRLEHDASAVQKQVSLSWRDAAGVILLQDGIQMHYPQDEHESPMVLRVSASRLFTKRKIKLGHLLEPWLTSIFLSACESQARVKWIYSDAVVSVNALDCDQSSQSLRKLLCAYNLGQTLVLPLPFQTALAYVMGESLENAKKAYEGSKFDGGNDFAELQDPCWAREYSSFDDLMKVPNLTALWKQLYQPLLEWSQTNIDIQEFQKT